MSLVRRTCSVGLTDSRHQSHALLAYEGNMVVNAKIRSFAYFAT
jgi:hypothetical protein